MRVAGLTAGQAIAQYKQAAIKRVFPAQYYESRLEEIEADAAEHNRSAQTALKLLFDKRFDK